MTATAELVKRIDRIEDRLAADLAAGDSADGIPELRRQWHAAIMAWCHATVPLPPRTADIKRRIDRAKKKRTRR